MQGEILATMGQANIFQRRYRTPKAYTMKTTTNDKLDLIKIKLNSHKELYKLEEHLKKGQVMVTKKKLNYVQWFL